MKEKNQLQIPTSLSNFRIGTADVLWPLRQLESQLVEGLQIVRGPMLGAPRRDGDQPHLVGEARHRFRRLRQVSVAHP